MLTKSNLFSVCVLTYNHAHLIETTLDSIEGQTLKGFEILISDDCSTDYTWSILQQRAKVNPNIRPIRTPTNLGMPGNANFAISNITTPYIALLHHDDLCRDDMLEKWLDLADKYPEIGFVFNPYGVDGSTFVYREKMPGDLIDGIWLLKNYLFPRWGCVIRGTALIKRDAWVSVGGMRPHFGLLADIDLWMRLSMLGPVGFVDEPIQILRQERPIDYPEEYKSKSWSWSRQCYLYQIHAANRLAFYDLSTIFGRLNWWKFRLRLSFETAKWLTYAVIKRKFQIIISSHESITVYDLFLLRLYRSVLKSLVKLFFI